MKGISLIVKTITNIIIGFIFIFGLYIILHGHLTPGGGFAGGVIIAGVFVLKVLAFGSDVHQTKNASYRTSILESIGGILFVGIAICGLIFAGVFFRNLLPRGIPLHLASGGIIPFCNIAIGIKVGAGLFSIFLALAAIKYKIGD